MPEEIRNWARWRSGAASRLWEGAAPAIGLQREGIPWKTAWRSVVKGDGEHELRDGWAIQVGRRQPRAGAAGRRRPRSAGLTAAKCRTGPCHERKAGGLWANSEAAYVSNGKGGDKKVNLHLTARKQGFVILASESALSSTTLLKRPDN